jgi:molecular chaperone GrpE
MDEGTIRDGEGLPAAVPATGAREDDGSTAETGPGFTVVDRRFWTLPEEELEAETARSSLPTFVEQLRIDLEKKDAQLKEYIAAYKREVVEELEKTKKRLERDAAQRVERLRGELAQPMLEVLDALERSVRAAEGGAGGDALLEGVRGVQRLMTQKLHEIGLARIEALGLPFDPTRHEAVAVALVDDPAASGKVVAEVKTGFTLGEKVIRATQVQVAKLRS